MVMRMNDGINNGMGINHGINNDIVVMKGESWTILAQDTKSHVIPI